MLSHLPCYFTWRSCFLFFASPLSHWLASLYFHAIEKVSAKDTCGLWPLEGQCHTVVNPDSGCGKRLEKLQLYSRSLLGSCLMLRLPLATEALVRPSQVPKCWGCSWDPALQRASCLPLCPSAWALCCLALAVGLLYCICSAVSNETSSTFFRSQKPQLSSLCCQNLQLFFFFIFSIVFISKQAVYRK